MHSAIILAARGGLAAVQVPSCHLTLQPVAMPWRWPPSTPHPGGRRWTGWGRSGAGQLSGQPWAPPAPPGQPNPALTLPGSSWTWAPAGMSQVSWWMGLVVVPMPPGSLLSWVVCHLSKLPKEAADSPPPKPVTPRRVWGLLLPPPALVVLVQIGIRIASVLCGFFLSSFSSFPTAAISGMNKSILCSCIWCQRAPFVQPNPPPTGALCRGRQEENGDIVRPGAGGGRNAAGVYRLLGAEWGMWVPRKELWGGWGDIRAHPAQQGSSQRDLLRCMTST